ncbi:MAG: PAS domain S-box protein [Chloroflexi bacterium]|nr:MAG: PAS domain S-box protein [Chloroflexota bacterium]
MRDVMERREQAAPDARETLEPMLDDLARGLGYDRALVLAPEADRQSLRGLFGLNIRDEIVRSMSVPLARQNDPLVAALRSGIPQLVADVATDDRLTEDERHALLAMNVLRFVAASIPSDGSERSSAVVVLGRDRDIGSADVERLLPLARQAGAALTREHDVELLRRASESHAIEKEWLWWMLNSVDDPVLVSDAENDIIHFNRRAEVLFRASDEDSAGKRRAVWMNNFLFTASLSTWTLDRAMRVSTNREVTLVDPIDGSELIFEVITRPALNHRTGDRGTVSVLKDVTDIRHMTVELTRSAQRIQTADEEIRAERDRIDLVLRSVPNPIIVVGIDNQIISLNAAAQRLFTPRAGRRQHALANDAKFTSFLAQLHLEPAPHTRAELTLVDPLSEEKLEMEITASEVRDQHGAVVAIVSAMQEVGRLRELERRRLEQVLFETEKLAATGRLAASIAHEINNPLEAVQNALYLLSGAVTREKKERRFLDIAQRETQRMSRILRQMLGFYRPTKVVTQVDVNALIDEAEALVAKQLRAAKVMVARELDPELPPIRGSADQLKQVLLNLFLNAAEAMPEGGTLSVATRYGAGEGDIPYEAVRIEVKDTGVGIDEETQARIFEPFFSTKAQRGTGLGLWVSHGIVQGHGGTIKVKSRPGQGTTFTIALPVAGPPDDDA